MVLALSQLAGCGGSGTSSSLSTSSMISGVAATGAPISNGKVQIKGSNGTVVEDTTGADGSYSANIDGLSEPFLVRVIAPSGEKYISVATQSALNEGKKVNVTPLTHIIVANVFEKSDADELFTNFTSEAANFTEGKLEEEKDALKQKFVDAGLLGSGKIASANIDLLNGEFTAGTSEGVDGLLDVVDVNTNASAGIEVCLKGTNSPIIVDKVDQADPPAVAINNAQLNASKAQLSVIDNIRSQLNALAALYSSKAACNGAPVDNGSSCDVDTLLTQFSPYFHADYQEDGKSGSAGVWKFICGDEGDVSSKATCLSDGEMQFFSVMLKDVTLLNYDDTSKIAMVKFNMYKNGELEHAEEMAMKLDTNDNKFKLAGNKRTFRYYISAESVFSSDHDSSSTQNSYMVNLNMYYKDSGSYTFNGTEVFTLTADSGNQFFPGQSATQSLYLVRGPMNDSGSCTDGLVFSSRPDPYKTVDNMGNETYQTFAQACAATNDPCNCQAGGVSAYFDWDKAAKITLSSSEVAKMAPREKILLTGNGVNDEFIISRPLILNQYNVNDWVPSFGLTVDQFCSSYDPRTSSALALSVGKGELNWLSLWMGFSDANNSTWNNEGSQNELDGTSDSVTPNFSVLQNTDVIHYKGLYLSSRDEFERTFIRNVSCH